MKKFVFVLLCLVMGGVLLADIDKGQVRQLVDTYKNSVLQIRVIINTWSVFQGQESNKQEEKYEVDATVIDKNGTLVTSAYAVDPSKLFQRMFGEREYQMKSELKELKIIFPDNKEIDGKVVLRDDKLDLVFIRPKSAEGIQFQNIDLDNSIEPELLDEVIYLQRLGEKVDRAIYVSLTRIAAIITKPRIYYLAMGSNDLSPGALVFSPDGKLIGINTIRILDMEGSSSSFSSESPFMQVILPAKAIKEIASQIKE
ncbi:trypsin-like peptidase domain-containing protein [bacterium]|nr:trypsin-like peptidase domain-containing protein [bacterium]